MCVRPSTQADCPIYSNFDHEFHLDVAVEVFQNPELYAQHAAWNFCGWVWFSPEDGKWYEQVMQYRGVVDCLTGETPQECIEQAIEKYGAD